MEKADVLKALGALAHEVRLDVFRKLVVAGRGGMTPKVLSEQLDVAPTKLSFHLKELAIAGLVTQEQDGRFLIYRAAYDRMDGLIAYLTENCCQGVPVSETAEAASCRC
jgi:ArsR family transcriptional regulator, arsenate/arsenite/antimonite-responsive transcriptional repressor